MENPNIIDIKSISLSGRLKHFLKLVLLAKVLPGLYIVKRQKSNDEKSTAPIARPQKLKQLLMRVIRMMYVSLYIW